jgi:cytoskeletal protein RodZ
MSFILDALRKVEKERKEPSAIELDQLIQKKGGKGSSTPRPNSFLIGLTALLVSGMAIWFFLDRYTNFSVPPFPGSKRSQRVVMAPVGAVKPGAMPQPQTPITGNEPSTPSEEAEKTPAQSVGPETSQQTATASQAVKSSAPITGSSIKKKPKKSAITQAPAKSARAERTLTPAKKRAQQPPMEQRRAKAVPKAEPPSKPKSPTLVRTSRFLLEGILFHSDVDKRSAMIRDRRDGKNRLVKVGDTFRGYTVEVIEISKVILLKGNSMIVLKL